MAYGVKCPGFRGLGGGLELRVSAEEAQTGEKQPRRRPHKNKAKERASQSTTAYRGKLWKKNGQKNALVLGPQGLLSLVGSGRISSC